MSAKTKFSVMNEASNRYWASELFRMASTPLFIKPRPLTRMERLKLRIRNARMALGSWIAGTNLHEWN